MAWIYLIVAGLFEVAMALCLKESAGFTRLYPSLGTLVTGVISFTLLSIALKQLPVGTAYAVWTGIGAAGTAIIGMAFRGEPATALRMVAVLLIIAGVGGLRLAGES